MGKVNLFLISIFNKKRYEENNNDMVGSGTVCRILYGR